jgi:hypothetical protein
MYKIYNMKKGKRVSEKQKTGKQENRKQENRKQKTGKQENRKQENNKIFHLTMKSKLQRQRLWQLQLQWQD